MQSFNTIFNYAAEQHGGADIVEEKLNYYWAEPKTNKQLLAMPDSEALAAMAQSIFQAGFSWRVVEQKMPEIAAAMDDFNVYAIAMWPDERIESLMNDRRVIRHYTKILAIRNNAQWLLEIAQEHGSFGQFISKWPTNDLIGLFLLLKKEGSRLGGNSGPLALRRMGKDTFVLTPDVIRALQREEVLDATVNPTTLSQKNMRLAQGALNHWYDECQASNSKCSYQEISRILAMSVGRNR